MYAGGPLLNLRLLGLFIFETEILLKLLCQQLYFTDFLRALQLKSTFKYYDLTKLIPNEVRSGCSIVLLQTQDYTINISVLALLWKGLVLGYRSYDCEEISVFLAVFHLQFVIHPRSLCALLFLYLSDLEDLFSLLKVNKLLFL